MQIIFTIVVLELKNITPEFTGKLLTGGSRAGGRHRLILHMTCRGQQEDVAACRLKQRQSEEAAAAAAASVLGSRSFLSSHQEGAFRQFS